MALLHSQMRRHMIKHINFRGSQNISRGRLLSYKEIRHSSGQALSLESIQRNVKSVGQSQTMSETNHARSLSGFSNLLLPSMRMVVHGFYIVMRRSHDLCMIVGDRSTHQSHEWSFNPYNRPLHLCTKKGNT